MPSRPTGLEGDERLRDSHPDHVTAPLHLVNHFLAGLRRLAIAQREGAGFLRDETSLIQSIGRAARHVNAKSLLFANTVPGSVIQAIVENA